LSQHSNEPLQYQDSYVVIDCLKCPAGNVKGCSKEIVSKPRRRLWASSRNSLVSFPALWDCLGLEWFGEGEM